MHTHAHSHTLTDSGPALGGGGLTRAGSCPRLVCAQGQAVTLTPGRCPAHSGPQEELGRAQAPLSWGDGLSWCRRGCLSLSGGGGLGRRSLCWAGGSRGRPPGGATHQLLLCLWRNGHRREVTWLKAPPADAAGPALRLPPVTALCPTRLLSPLRADVKEHRDSLALVSRPLSRHPCAMALTEGAPSLVCRGRRRWSSRRSRTQASTPVCSDLVLCLPQRADCETATRDSTGR